MKFKSLNDHPNLVRYQEGLLGNVRTAKKIITGVTDKESTKVLSAINDTLKGWNDVIQETSQLMCSKVSSVVPKCIRKHESTFESSIKKAYSSLPGCLGLLSKFKTYLDGLITVQSRNYQNFAAKAKAALFPCLSKRDDQTALTCVNDAVSFPVQLFLRII